MTHVYPCMLVTCALFVGVGVGGWVGGWVGVWVCVGVCVWVMPTNCVVVFTVAGVVYLQYVPYSVVVVVSTSACARGYLPMHVLARRRPLTVRPAPSSARRRSAHRTMMRSS